MEAEKIKQIMTYFSKALALYNSRKDNNTIQEIIVDYLISESIDKSESYIISSNISDTIDSINTNYDELRNAKANGISSIDHLRDILNETNKKYNINIDKLFLPNLSTPENNIVKYSDEPMEYSENIINGLKIKCDDDIEKFNDEDYNDNWEEIEMSIQPDDYDTFFNSEINSKEDSGFKKKIAAATVVLNNNGYLDTYYKGYKISNDTLPYIVDKSLTLIKLAYNVKDNQSSIDCAVDILVDRYCAIFITIIEKSVVNSSENIGIQIGALLGSVFGPAGQAIGAAIGGVIGKIIGKKLADKITVGIRLIADKVKDIVKSIITKFVSVVSSIFNYIIS